MAAGRTIVFNVRRFDGERSFSQRYELPYAKDTLLGCLTKIREQQDPTLCFTSACRHAICGSCAVQVNGSAFLACETQLDSLLDTFGTDELSLEPLNNLPVVRDLVVDFDGPPIAFFAAAASRSAANWLMTTERTCRPQL